MLQTACNKERERDTHTPMLFVFAQVLSLSAEKTKTQVFVALFFFRLGSVLSDKSARVEKEDGRVGL